mmetsp:Transcript_1960/g.7455  ORF Transcript_1960/g.7455 Transcript_1960/m.7455 type:complete len:380 (-) Transcript_1960:1802-2941(-)
MLPELRQAHEALGEPFIHGHQVHHGLDLEHRHGTHLLVHEPKVQPCLGLLRRHQRGRGRGRVLGHPLGPLAHALFGRGLLRLLPVQHRIACPLLRPRLLGLTRCRLGGRLGLPAAGPTPASHLFLRGLLRWCRAMVLLKLGLLLRRLLRQRQDRLGVAVYLLDLVEGCMLREEPEVHAEAEEGGKGHVAALLREEARGRRRPRCAAALAASAAPRVLGVLAARLAHLVGDCSHCGELRRGLGLGFLLGRFGGGGRRLPHGPAVGGPAAVGIAQLVRSRAGAGAMVGHGGREGSPPALLPGRCGGGSGGRDGHEVLGLLLRLLRPRAPAVRDLGRVGRCPIRILEEEPLEKRPEARGEVQDLRLQQLTGQQLAPDHGLRV